VSVLLGLSRDSKNVKMLYTLGIGPNKMDWVAERCEKMGVDIHNFPFKWKHYSLHDNNFATYQDQMPESFGGIDFHPTYEGKMIRYLKTQGWVPEDGTVGFWIVGSEPKLEVIEKFYTHDPDAMLEEPDTFNLDEVAKALYEANPATKPAWDQLGDVTRSVWRERALEQGGE